jgi:hypothetical protein
MFLTCCFCDNIAVAWWTTRKGAEQLCLDHFQDIFHHRNFDYINDVVYRPPHNSLPSSIGIKNKTGITQEMIEQAKKVKELEDFARKGK